MLLGKSKHKYGNAEMEKKRKAKEASVLLFYFCVGDGGRIEGEREDRMDEG